MRQKIRSHVPVSGRGSIKSCRRKWVSPRTSAETSTWAPWTFRQPGSLQETLRSILADEVGHARFGWVLLDQLAPRIGSARAVRLDAWLRLAFGHVEAHELRELAPGPSPSRAATDVGVCDGDEARRLFYDTVRDVIIPGLERRGLLAGWAWSHRVTPTAALAA